jgi:hypothetical protein
MNISMCGRIDIRIAVVNQFGISNITNMDLGMFANAIFLLQFKLLAYLELFIM